MKASPITKIKPLKLSFKSDSFQSFLTFIFVKNFYRTYITKIIFKFEGCCFLVILRLFLCLQQIVMGILE